MVEVFVELWGQIEDSNACSWITVGKIDAVSLDIDYLKEEVMKIVKRQNSGENQPGVDQDLSTGNWPRANIARLKVMSHDKGQTDAKGRPVTEMKITLEDLW